MSEEIPWIADRPVTNRFPERSTTQIKGKRSRVGCRSGNWSRYRAQLLQERYQVGELDLERREDPSLAARTGVGNQVLVELPQRYPGFLQGEEQTSYLRGGSVIEMSDLPLKRSYQGSEGSVGAVRQEIQFPPVRAVVKEARGRSSVLSWKPLPPVAPRCSRCRGGALLVCLALGAL